MRRYCRTPSPNFEALLAPGGFLSPLLRRRDVAGLPLDIHLRAEDHVHLYCGLTRLADVRSSSDGRSIWLDASETYKGQNCARSLFRRWSVEEKGFETALNTYFEKVKVAPRHCEKEGAVQSAWAGVTRPWTPFDREAVFGYDNTEEQTKSRIFPQVAKARAELMLLRAKHPEKWAAMPDTKARSRPAKAVRPGRSVTKGRQVKAVKQPAELDQLAVDASGRLVLLELKHSKASGVCYAPFQLLQYVHEWACALDEVRADLHKLIDARMALGLSPRDMPRLKAGIRPVIGFGADGRSAEVRARFEEVRALVNHHLPEGASPVEVWVVDNSGTPQLA